MDRDTLSILILSYNRLDDLKENLEYLLKAFPKNQICVVDNNSSDGTVNYLKTKKAESENLDVILNDTNLGVAEGRNTGRRKLKSKYILHLDDDTHISKNEVEKLVGYLESNLQIGVVSPRVIHKSTAFQQNEHGDETKEVGNYHGACHLVRYEALKVTGDIDPECTFGGEEIDYSIRLRENGFGVAYLHIAKAIHNNFTRVGVQNSDRRKKRVYNYCRIHHKHFTFRNALPFSLRYTTSHIKSAIKNGLINAPLIYPWYMLKGVLSGRRQHEKVKKSVESYYRDKNTRPDFGNVPLVNKLQSR